MGSPRWSGICYIDQAGLELRDPSASVSAPKCWIKRWRQRSGCYPGWGYISVCQHMSL